jgi:AcrR family transcriptional regulator
VVVDLLRLVGDLRLLFDHLLDRLAALVERLLQLGAADAADFDVLERLLRLLVVVDPAQHHLPVQVGAVGAAGLGPLLGLLAVLVGEVLLQRLVAGLQRLAVGAAAGVLAVG